MTPFAVLFLSLVLCLFARPSLGFNNYLYLAEAESGRSCYTGYEEGVEIFNSLMASLPARHLNDEVLISRDLTLLDTLLAVGVSPKQAVHRTLLTAWPKGKIPTVDPMQLRRLLGAKPYTELSARRIRPDAPFLACLRGAHLTGVIASLQAPSEVQAHAFLLQSASLSAEETMTFDGTYATNYTKAVVAAALAGARKKR